MISTHTPAQLHLLISGDIVWTKMVQQKAEKEAKSNKPGKPRDKAKKPTKKFKDMTSAEYQEYMRQVGM